MTSMSIGQVAKRAGVSIDTVRYYERNGLLAPAARLASGYRRYNTPELKRLNFIRRAKSLGSSLDDIRSLLALSAERSVAKIKRAAKAKRNDLDRRIASSTAYGLHYRHSSMSVPVTAMRKPVGF